MRRRLSALLGLLVLQFACQAQIQAPGADVLLITVDTLRPDYIHAYGFPLEITPSMDALAARGVLFENAIAAATLTAPAHASIMTSRYVREHSVGSRNGDTRLEGLPTLAEHFAEAGYETAAFISNVVLRRRVGLDRGFETYDDELPAQEQNRDRYFERFAEATAHRALAWLKGRSPGKPIFLWLHLQDPHGPYTPPSGWSGKIDRVPLKLQRDLVVLSENFGRAGIPFYQALGELRDPALYAARYAEEIQYADHWAGQVISAVEKRSGERGSIILLTADHGESLGENGWFFQHGQSTAPELARVPFIVAAPGLVPGRIAGPVSHVDIAPTLLDVIGLEVPDEIDGVKQRPMDGVSMRYSFNDADAPNAKKVQYYEMFGNRSVWADGWKAVTLHGNRMPWDLNTTYPFDNDEWELYHVAEDFSGANNLADEHPEKLAELQKLFGEYHLALPRRRAADPGTPGRARDDRAVGAQGRATAAPGPAPRVLRGASLPGGRRARRARPPLGHVAGGRARFCQLARSGNSRTRGRPGSGRRPGACLRSGRGSRIPRNPARDPASQPGERTRRVRW